MNRSWKSLAAVCALVIGLYAYMAQSGVLELVNLTAADSYYNLLVQGFCAGQLSLKKEVPFGFTRLADPYDPAANIVYQPPPYRMLDLSYYKGKLYLYFGVTPALLLFWPYAALTGQCLFHRQAVAIFCTIGFLVSVGVLHGLRRRYFGEVSAGVTVACALALGLATGVPVLLSSSDVYEVAISCGYMLTMLALGAIWCALHEPERRCRWLAAASMAYGLAVGARPSLLFGAIILLVPVAQAWRERRRIGAQLIAATAPILLIGSGLMLYNVWRFDNPFEFGQHYQLSAVRALRPLFSLRYLWFNFRVYFLEPARWSIHFPFVREAAVGALPAGYSVVRSCIGVLTSIPAVWLALAIPLAWRNRAKQTDSTLRWFVTAIALLFGTCALTVSLFFGANFRYAVDFLPALLLLAVVGILGAERALADRPPIWRNTLRWGWSLLVGFSVAINLLMTVGYYAEAHNSLAVTLARQGRLPEAIGHFQQALRLKPDYAEVHNNLGSVLGRAGQLEEAVEQYEQALRISPDYADAHNNLGITLARLGRLPEAMRHWQEALRLQPDFAEVDNNAGIALKQAGMIKKAIGYYEQALRIRPDYADAHYNLGVALEQTGRLQDALEQYEQALRINPDFAVAHYNLGVALARLGRLPEAMGHWEEAVRITPDYADAHNNLGNALLEVGRLRDAIGHYEQALQINPNLAEAHCNLGVALEQAGRLQDALEHYEQALRINPDYATARNAIARLKTPQ